MVTGSFVRGSAVTTGLRRARGLTSGVFGVQGFAVAGLYTTLPAASSRFDISTAGVTAILVGVMLCAGAGSFVGLALIGRHGLQAAMRIAVASMAVALIAVAAAPGTAVAVAGYLAFGLAIGCVDVSENTSAAIVERLYGRSVFASFFAFFSGAGVAGALLTSGATHLGWSVGQILALQGGLVLAYVPLMRGAREVLTASPAAIAEESPIHDRGLWKALLPFGVVMLVLYVVDSTTSAWTTVFLHRDLDAALSIAPLGFAAYQAGTLAGRACADRFVRRHGPVRVIRWFSGLVAVGLFGISASPHWATAVAGAAVVGIGASVLVPLSLAAGGRLRPGGAEAVLARLNIFNYAGVLSGSALGGALGSGGHFRLAYAAPAAVVLMIPFLGRAFEPPAPK
jgi:hypothetical protein